MKERRLILELSIVLAVKLILLFALWWMFVRNERIDVDAARMAHAISAAAPATQAATEVRGEPNGR